MVLRWPVLLSLRPIGKLPGPKAAARQALQPQAPLTLQLRPRVSTVGGGAHARQPCASQAASHGRACGPSAGCHTCPCLPLPGVGIRGVGQQPAHPCPYPWLCLWLCPLCCYYACPLPNTTSKKTCNCHVLFIGHGGVPAVLQPACGAFPARPRRAYQKTTSLCSSLGIPFPDSVSKFF